MSFSKQFALFIILVVNVAAVPGRDVHAQAELLPAVRLSYAGFEGSDVWPGDFNRDGITDLAGRAFNPSSGRFALAIALGRGDGTFFDAVVGSHAVTPWAVGDLNRDGRLDVVGIDRSTADHRNLTLVLGNGDGTLASASTIAAPATGELTFALVTDLDGDGIRDVVAGEEPDRINLYPGLGDGTFGTPAVLVTGRGPNDGIAVDVNGDGARDLAIANTGSASVSIFINGGSFLFSRSDLMFDGPVNDITVRDVDGDRALDLIVATAARDGTVYGDGRVHVLSGNGDGTFDAPVAYRTGRGAYRIVAGDFTHDGRTDIATGNRSAVVSACSDTRLTYWDTVSILAGRADGTFADPVDFSLDAANEPYDGLFLNSLASLNTSDLDGDGHTDLVASDGAVLVTRAPASNRAPAPEGDFLFADDPVEYLIGRARDPDSHALTFTWTDEQGRTVGNEPSPCVRVATGESTFTLTVDDGHGGRTSTAVGAFFPTEAVLEVTQPSDFSSGPVIYADQPFEIGWRRRPDLFSSFDLFVQDTEGNASLEPIPGCQGVDGSLFRCVWPQPGPASTRTRQIILVGHRSDGVRDAQDVSTPFEIRATASGPLPTGWEEDSVGNVGVGGASRFEDGVLTIQGSGADIWGTADEFHWIWRVIEGDFEAVTRVASIENVDRWTKAGLMIRTASHEASAPHVSLFATPGNGIAFQRRHTPGGASVHTAGPTRSAPIWLRLVRNGNTITAFYRQSESDPWTRIASDSYPSPGYAFVGLAVTSHVDGTLATATFDNVTINHLRAWRSTDVGNVGFAGSFVDSGGAVTVNGSGADIWNTADAFRFVYMPMSGDGSVVARVASVEETHAWAKAAVMIRESTAPESRHAMTLVSAGKGLAHQYRTGTGSQSGSSLPVQGAAPAWIRIAREGNTFVSSVSEDGSSWQELGRVTIDMRPDVLAGLAVTSHTTSTLATAVFDSIRIEP